VLASKGYPEKPEVGEEISGLDAEGRVEAPGKVFHAGVRREASQYYTGGGRVIGVAASDQDLSSCRRVTYSTCSSIAFDGQHYRSDVGAPTKVGGRAAVEARNA